MALGVTLMMTVMEDLVRIGMTGGSRHIEMVIGCAFKVRVL